MQRPACGIGMPRLPSCKHSHESDTQAFPSPQTSWVILGICLSLVRAQGLLLLLTFGFVRRVFGRTFALTKRQAHQFCRWRVEAAELVIDCVKLAARWHIQ